jgi:hypothetical protein
MIAFLIELWSAKHAHIDLRRDLIRVLRLVFAIPPANRAEVIKELQSGYGDVATERARIVASTQEYEVV